MTSFDREYKRLNDKQREAVDSIEGPVLVVAGPGTGKTQLLSMRVANILKKTDVNPYNILCLTYTESGKEAMTQRLTNFIGEAAKKVEVHTFHGFGTRLINRFPDYFPELANFRPAEDLTLYEALYTCLAALPRKNPLSKQAYGKFTYQADARERISQLKRAGISPATALVTASSDLDWCKSTGSKLATIFNKAGRLSPKVIDRLSNEVQPILGHKQSAELGSLCIADLKETLYNSLATGKTAALSSFKKKWFISDDGQLYFKATDQVKKLLSLAELYSTYEKELVNRRLYDYDDMILYALEKLKNNRDFRSLVQESFQYILADEYQDTNSAQASIINLIADNPVHEGKPNVMVVGDDDQAIYGFQGALGDVLLKFRELWREVRVIVLKENYRSTRPILETARKIITQGQQRFENVYEDIDKSLLPNSRHPNIEPLMFEAASAEAVLDKTVQSAKSVNVGDQLAIIATKHKYLLNLAEKLDAAKVKYFYEGHENLLNDPALSELLLLTDCILAIKQKIYDRTNYVLPELIASGSIKMSRQIAWQIALKAKKHHYSWWQAINTFQNKDVANAARSLNDLAANIHNKASVQSLKLIAKVYNLRVLQKINQLNNHAKSYFGRDEISLSELLRYIELCRQAGVSLDYKVVKGNQKSPVVLLSAHRSKGLEFDRVYLLHADYFTWFKEGGSRNNLVLPPNWQIIEPLKANNDDRLRLLYVVMTRARQELGFIRAKDRPNIVGLENMKAEPYVSEQLEVFNIPKEKSWRYWFLPTDETEKQELKKLLEPTLDSYQLSPTHITMFLDVPHGGPVNFLTNILLRIPEPVHPEALFGSLIHRCLRFAQEFLNKNGKLPSKSALESFIKKVAIKQNDILLADAVGLVMDYIASDHILRPGAVSEYSFSSEDIRLASKRLTGTVDHYSIEDNKLTITDFKTGRAINSWRVTEEYYKQKLRRFRQQLLFYELLFSLSSKFNYETVISQIDFVEPSRRDVYYRLSLDADKEERQRLEYLINAVWNCITNFELPDIDKYSLDFKGIQDFEDDLIADSN